LLASIYTRFEEEYKDSDAKPPRIPDPMLGNNVAFNWQRSHFEGFIAHVKESRIWAQRALALDDDHVEDAVSLWQNVFADTFPTTTEVRAKAYAEARKSGKVFVDQHGKVLINAPAVAAVSAPTHRFFGDDSAS
jgi:hypothetical protein